MSDLRIEQLRKLEAETPTQKSTHTAIAVTIGLFIATVIVGLLNKFSIVPYGVFDMTQLAAMCATGMTVVIVVQRKIYENAREEYERMRREFKEEKQ